MALTTAQMGLKSWNQTSDLFDHDQLADNWAKIDLHDHTLNKGVQIPTAGIVDGAITAAKMAAVDVISSAQIVNGSITNSKFVLTTQQQLGLTDGAQVGRGKSVIATSESRTNVAYGTLATPDRITGVVLPTDSLIVVLYSASWLNGTASNGRAAIFIGANQLVVPDTAQTLAPSHSPPVVQAAIGPTDTSSTASLVSYPGGLVGANITDNRTADATTGQVVGYFQSEAAAGVNFATGTPGGQVASAGGPCYIFAAAGTYDISVQFKSAAGAVTVSNRKLWVWTIGF